MLLRCGSQALFGCWWHCLAQRGLECEITRPRLTKAPFAICNIAMEITSFRHLLLMRHIVPSELDSFSYLAFASGVADANEYDIEFIIHRRFVSRQSQLLDTRLASILRQVLAALAHLLKAGNPVAQSLQSSPRALQRLTYLGSIT